MKTIRFYKGALVATLIATVAAFAGTAMATTIVQDLGSSHLAFEAESFASLDDINSDGDTWTVITDAGATGGSAIQATGPANGTSFTHSNDGEAVYNLEFTKPTDFYWVYARYRNLGDASSDSFLTSSVNTAHSDPLRRWFDGPADANRSVGNASHGTTGTYYYAFLGATAAVPAGAYEFRVGIREKDVELDRFLFVDSSSGGPANGLVSNGRAMDVSVVLDGLPNSSITTIPEPTSLALLAVGMLATLRNRRR